MPSANVHDACSCGRHAPAPGALASAFLAAGAKPCTLEAARSKATADAAFIVIEVPTDWILQQPRTSHLSCWKARTTTYLGHLSQVEAALPLIALNVASVQRHSRYPDVTGHEHDTALMKC